MARRPIRPMATGWPRRLGWSARLHGVSYRRRKMGSTVNKVDVPDSTLAREITELVRDTETPLLFNHSSRVYHWGSLAGQRRRLKFDPELLYAGAMFHDMGLIPKH